LHSISGLFGDLKHQQRFDTKMAFDRPALCTAHFQQHLASADVENIE
jgi:hypothetical protein